MQNYNIVKKDSHCSDLFSLLILFSRGFGRAFGSDNGSTKPLLRIEFDKDIDDHMRVIAACANLRARNYKIPEADFHTTRYIDCSSLLVNQSI